MSEIPSSVRRLVAIGVVVVAFASSAYLPPVEERCGVKVEIGSFPQKIERNNKNPFAWPLGVTEVEAGAPRAFPVTLENKTDKPVTGTLEVWMNDDWDVAGPQGPLTLAPGEKKELSYTGTSRPRALNALYPVHARFTPAGAKKEDAPHPIAIFMYKNPDAPRPVRKTAPPKLGPGAFSLDAGFARTTFIEVKGKVMSVDADGAPKEWGAHMTKGRPSPRGEAKAGFSTHPPYKKGARIRPTRRAQGSSGATSRLTSLRSRRSRSRVPTFSWTTTTRRLPMARSTRCSWWRKGMRRSSSARRS